MKTGEKTELRTILFIMACLLLGTLVPLAVILWACQAGCHDPPRRNDPIWCRA